MSMIVAGLGALAFLGHLRILYRLRQEGLAVHPVSWVFLAAIVLLLVCATPPVSGRLGQPLAGLPGIGLVVLMPIEARMLARASRKTGATP